MGLGMMQDGGRRVLGDVDLLSSDDLRRLAEVTGPCVSLYLPTAPFGPGTRSGSSQLHRLANQAAADLANHGVAAEDVDALLAPVRELQDDEPFWQRQSEGLALFAAPGFFDGFRLPASFSEQVAVGEAFRLLPLVGNIGGDSSFYVLALSQNAVRVLEASEHTVTELDLSGLPHSLEEAVPEAEAERVRGVHSVGALGAVTHGQGTEADYDKASLERYFRAVDEPVVAHLGKRGAPLVLASVGYYLPIYRSVSRFPLVWEHAVEGNPEHRSAQELHDEAWKLVADHFQQENLDTLATYREAAGTGRTLTGADQVLAAAQEGRVEAMLVDRRATTSGDDVLDLAVLETLRRSGRVVPVGEDSDLPEATVAVLRY